MIDLMTEPDVIIDENCCLNWRTPDGTRQACDREALWEIQRRGEPLALSCDQDLPRVLGLAYSYEPDETTYLDVVPTTNLTVHASLPTIGGEMSASLRPVPTRAYLQARGHVTRNDAKSR